MSASPLFRQLLSSQPSVPVGPQPKLPKVLNMSDIQIITPPETTRDNARKSQMMRALHRIFAKSSSGQSSRPVKQSWSGASAVPSTAAGDLISSSQSPRTGSVDAFLAPPLPTPSMPRIGVISMGDIGRSRTPQACERCRERKTKCSGTRPTCKRCLARGAQCIYVLDHKANRAQFKKLKEASGLFPKSLRPAHKEHRAQRKVSPSTLFRLLKSGALGHVSVPGSHMAASAPSDSSFELLDLSPPKPRLGSSPLASMSYTAPDASYFSQVQAPAQPATSTSELNSSYSFMEMDSDMDAAMAFMMANENGVQQANGWDSSFNAVVPPMAMPSLSLSSGSGSGSSNGASEYSPLPTPLDEDVLMMDMFGPDALAECESSGAELPCSDSELERELETCMAELLGHENDTAKFGVDFSRPVKSLPIRPGQGARFIPPVTALPGRSFPEVSSDGAFFDEHLFEAFLPPPVLPQIPEIKVEMVETNAETGNLETDVFNKLSLDELFGLKNDALHPQSYLGDKLRTIVEEPTETNVDDAAIHEPVPATLWAELFGDEELDGVED